MHRAPLLLALGSQAEPGLDCKLLAAHELRRIAAHGRPVFEAMSRAAAHEPDVPPLRVPIDEEVAARGVLVLADPKLVERRMGERGETTRHVSTHCREELRRG